MPLTSILAKPKLQSLTDFGGCDAVEISSPIKRKTWSARDLKMLIQWNEHFLFGNLAAGLGHATAPSKSSETRKVGRQRFQASPECTPLLRDGLGCQ
jgi:hypothetical protein